jgi:F-box-like
MGAIKVLPKYLFPSCSRPLQAQPRFMPLSRRIVKLGDVELEFWSSLKVSKRKKGNRLFPRWNVANSSKVPSFDDKIHLRVPHEITCQILSIYAQQSDASLYPILLVNPKWKSIAESMPDLWSTIYLTIDAPVTGFHSWYRGQVVCRNVETLQYILSLSKSRPLSIVLVIGGDHTLKRRNLFLHCMQEASSRVASLTVLDTRSALYPQADTSLTFSGPLEPRHLSIVSTKNLHYDLDYLFHKCAL